MFKARLDAGETVGERKIALGINIKHLGKIRLQYDDEMENLSKKETTHYSFRVILPYFFAKMLIMLRWFGAPVSNAIFLSKKNNIH